jgi:hypothetical protein
MTPSSTGNEDRSPSAKKYTRSTVRPTRFVSLRVFLGTRLPSGPDRTFYLPRVGPLRAILSVLRTGRGIRLLEKVVRWDLDVWIVRSVNYHVACLVAFCGYESAPVIRWWSVVVGGPRRLSRSARPPGAKWCSPNFLPTGKFPFLFLQSFHKQPERGPRYPARPTASYDFESCVGGTLRCVEKWGTDVSGNHPWLQCGVFSVRRVLCSRWTVKSRSGRKYVGGSFHLGWR